MMAIRDFNSKAEGNNDVEFTYEQGIASSRGYVATVHGFVIVASRNWHDTRRVTLFKFIYNGRRYTRREDRFYLPHSLSTAAKRFATEIVDRESR